MAPVGVWSHLEAPKDGSARIRFAWVHPQPAIPSSSTSEPALLVKERFALSSKRKNRHPKAGWSITPAHQPTTQESSTPNLAEASSHSGDHRPTRDLGSG